MLLFLRGICNTACFIFQDGQPVTSNGNVNIYSLSGGQLSGGTLQYTQAGLAGLTGSQEFVAAAGASPQYTYPTSPVQQSPASPQHQPQQNPGSPQSPGLQQQQQPLPSPTHQQQRQAAPPGQPSQALSSPTHTSMLPPPQDQPLSLVQQQQQQQNQQPHQQANNKIPDIILTGSTATTLADLEEILSCRESSLHGQYSLINISSMCLFIYLSTLFSINALLLITSHVITIIFIEYLFFIRETAWTFCLGRIFLLDRCMISL